MTILLPPTGPRADPGHHFDLEDLPYWLAEHDIQVAPRDEDYVLVIPFQVIGDDYEPLRKFVKNQLDLINGIGRRYFLILVTGND